MAILVRIVIFIWNPKHIADVLFSLVAIIYEGLRLHLGPVISASYQLHTGVGSQHAYDFHSAVHFMQVGEY